MRLHPAGLAAGVLLLLASPALAQRLPSTVIPDHYDLALEPNLATATFNGVERIVVTLRQPTTSIVLNAAEIQFGGVTITAAGRSQAASVSLDPAQEQARLTVPALMPAGPAEIAIRYRGILNNDLRGFYLSKANNRRYGVTQLEATDARRMFPSFDEPAFKSTFAITATIDAGDTAISNGAVLSDKPGPREGKHTIVFDTTPKMSTYLVALAVGDFECVSGASDGVPIRICSTPDKKGQTGLALEAAQEIARYYNRYYAVKYPFKKLDVVAVPDFSAGAMENTAAIFYRETFLLADPKTASLDVRKNIAIVLAHEMAHQWFGDLVTMQWWDDLWLNEGFANWMETKPLKAWRPEWHVELDEVKSNQKAMATDSLRSTRPIRSKASTPAEINELFDAIAYEKGAAVLRMVEVWVGEEAFRTGANAYIDKFKYANATADDFWGTVASSTGKPVDKVMSGFVDRPGVPLVDATLRCEGGKGAAVISQEKVAPRTPRRRAAAGPSSAIPAWAIPVCVKGEAGVAGCEVVEARPAALPLDRCQDWVMANAGARGYYRVVAPPVMVRRMAEAVASLEPTERIALLSDEWALVRAGRHEVGIFLDLASGFKPERSAAVMSTLVGPLTTIGQYLTTKETREPYARWLTSLLSPILEEVGWSGRPSDTDDTRGLRASLVSALGGVARDADVVAKARAMVLTELDAPGSVEPALLNAAVKVAATEGDAALYEKYVARSKAATTPEEHYRYLYALAAFSDPALVRRTFDSILGPEVRGQDVKLFLAALLSNRRAQPLVWRLLQSRWTEVQRKSGEFVGNTVVVAALASFCDARTLAEIRQFFRVHKVPDAERTLQQTIDQIEACVRMAATQPAPLAAWLKGR